MTINTHFKTLVNTWLIQKKPMITPSTHASFTLIAENHLIPYFGKRKIGSITEADVQSFTADGYDVYDDNGNIVAYGLGKTVAYGKYIKLVETNEKLQEEIIDLKEQIKALKAKKKG